MSAEEKLYSAEKRGEEGKGFDKINCQKVVCRYCLAVVRSKSSD